MTLARVECRAVWSAVRIDDPAFDQGAACTPHHHETTIMQSGDINPIEMRIRCHIDEIGQRRSVCVKHASRETPRREVLHPGRHVEPSIRQLIDSVRVGAAVAMSWTTVVPSSRNTVIAWPLPNIPLTTDFHGQAQQSPIVDLEVREFGRLGCRRWRARRPEHPIRCRSRLNRACNIRQTTARPPLANLTILGCSCCPDGSMGIVGKAVPFSVFYRTLMPPRSPSVLCKSPSAAHQSGDATFLALGKPKPAPVSSVACWPDMPPMSSAKFLIKASMKSHVGDKEMVSDQIGTFSRPATWGHSALKLETATVTSVSSLTGMAMMESSHFQNGGASTAVHTASTPIWGS